MARSDRVRRQTAGARAGTPLIVMALVVISSILVTGHAVPAARAADGAGPAAGHRAPAPATSRFEPVGPARLADTRQADCGCTRVSASTIRVQVAGRAGVAPHAVAAALTITADRVVAPGFVTVHPGGSERPTASMLNTAADTARANSTIVPLAADGTIDVFTSSAADLLVDVTGAFVAAVDAAAGRFVATDPIRIVDTRSPPRSLAIGEEFTVPRPSGVAADAQAVVVTVTVAEPLTAGFLSVYPAGAARSTASILNVTTGDRARAATTIVPISADGFTIYSSTGGHVLVDLVGWFTGDSASVSTDGLYVPAGPDRRLDTRAQAPRLHPDGTLELVGEPGAQAVVTNVTATRTDAAGYVTAYPAGTARPAVSALNPTGFDSTVANLAITRLSTRGTAYYSLAATDLIIDQTGYFTGLPVEAVAPPAPNVAPPPRVLLVGDSSLAGVRWYGQSAQALQGFVAVVDAESCRRLTTPSCRGREGRYPTNTVGAIVGKQMWFDVVVVHVGYNDWFDDFPAMMAEVIAAARSRGARQVVWLTYKDDGIASSETARRAYRTNNESLRAVAAGGLFPDLVVADWDGYTASAQGWFVADGVHFTVSGAYGAADYIARWIAHLSGAPCPEPWAPGTAPDDPCPVPDGHPVPDVMTLYGAQQTDVHCYEEGEERILVCERDRLLPP